ncbi:MAG: RNA-binding transcriptional accessory protein [Duncaniella sp.]|nr:RNA-binding transcriptional accessory protein [Duncaniella sp.]
MVNVHANIITQELGSHLRKHVAACLRLLDEGATVPFIARYRKEATGGMDEVTVHNVKTRHDALSELDKRKEYIKEVIKGAGALTPERESRIDETLDPVALEDIYLPYKPKRNTRAQAARALGLEPLARLIFGQKVTDPASAAVQTVDLPQAQALAGASDIIAEWVSEDDKARAIVRNKFQRSAVISSRVVKGKEAEGENYANYFAFSEPLRMCTSHRYLAMRRGEADGFLKVSIDIDDEEMIERLGRKFVRPEASPEVADFIKNAVKDGYKRLMRPSIETEIAAMTKEKSDSSAIQLFADNVRQLLMSAPLGSKRVLAIDPGYRTGCKVVVLDEQGKLLEHQVVFPTPPANDFVGAADTLCYLVDKYRVDALAVGTGSGGRETERFLRDVVFPRKVQVFMVSEQGASIYSASEAGREEFPNEDVTVRGAVSIGRRLLDPLAELVKIDPKSIGVGQYQHDVDQNRLRDALDFVVESCVNSVGVNVNTASRQLLSYVSGIGPTLASNIVKYRDENGPFATREDLRKVSRMGEKAFTQSAGFLRIPGGANPLDNTAVHPERYQLVEQMAKDVNSEISAIIRDRSKLHNIELDKFVTKQVGLPTLTDIIIELEKPGRDPRAAIEEPVYDEETKRIEDLRLGQELTGKVNNITAFGVFVDIGLKVNGLIHISQLSERFVSSPSEVVSIGQTVRVRVMDVDARRGRIALTMKGLAGN